jgi:O-antigen/teichoic acid export membrane protein
MLRYGWMVFPAGVASMAIKLLDTVVLGQFVPLALVGVYGIAAFIPIFIEAPINALDKIANARIAHSWEKNDINNIQDIYFKSSRYLFILGGLLFLLVSLNAEFLFQFLPSEFLKGVPVVAILSLSALFNLMTGSNSAIIFTSDKFTVGAVGLILVAVINLILLYTLIPVLGIEGAAWATCISSFAYNLFKYIYIWIKFKMQPFDKRTLFIGLSIVITYFLVNFIPSFESEILNILVTGFSIVLIYGILIWFTRVADDLKEMVPFFKKCFHFAL